MTFLILSLSLINPDGRNAYAYSTIVASAGNFTTIVHKNFATIVRTDLCILGELSLVAASEGAEEVGEEEDTCTIREADQKRASSAVDNVTRELTQLSKVTGALAQNRCIGLAESSANGVVCSSLMGSLARIQQSFVL